jgi:hypothetical protein
MTAVLADVVLVLHIAYAAFVIGGLLALPLGLWWRWRWVRSRTVRLAHALCTALVAVEACLGMICPLTWLEHSLLVASGKAGYDRSFIGHWLSWILYHDVPPWVFMAAYTVLAVTVIMLYYCVPPLPRLSRQRP